MQDSRDELSELKSCESAEARRELMADVFMRHRQRLHRMVSLRLDRRLQARIDSSDVLQEAYLECLKRLGGYLEEPRWPLYIWLRRVATYALREVHRRHLDAQARDPRREVKAPRSPEPAAASASMAAQLAADITSPSQAALRAEREASIEKALDALSPADREILALRFFERLTAAEAAEVLDIKEEAARKRFLRALKRFKSASGRSLEGLV